MIVIPNERMANLVPPWAVEHDVIFNNCAGIPGDRRAGGNLRAHRRATAERESMGEGPAGESQSRPGPSFLRRAAERGGAGTDRDATLAGGSAVPGDDEPGAAARLAEPLPAPSIFHVLTWLRYHARRRP